MPAFTILMLLALTVSLVCLFATRETRLNFELVALGTAIAAGLYLFPATMLLAQSLNTTSTTALALACVTIVLVSFPAEWAARWALSFRKLISDLQAEKENSDDWRSDAWREADMQRDEEELGQTYADADIRQSLAEQYKTAPFDFAPWKGLLAGFFLGEGASATRHLFVEHINEMERRLTIARERARAQ
jgi:hypothetical protein